MVPNPLKHILTNQTLGLKYQIRLVNLRTPRNKLLSTNIRRSLKSLVGKIYLQVIPYVILKRVLILISLILKEASYKDDKKAMTR